LCYLQGGEEHSAEQARQRLYRQKEARLRVIAFAAIARPEKFFNLLERCGAEVAARLSFDDPRRFTEQDYATLSKLRQEKGAQLVTTEKDVARMGDRLATLGADAFPVTLEFDDAAILDDALGGLFKPSDEARQARR